MVPVVWTGLVNLQILIFVKGFNHKMIYLLKKTKKTHFTLEVETQDVLKRTVACGCILPWSLGSFQPVCLAALWANSLWRYYGYWEACKPLSLYLQEKEKRLWITAQGRAGSWYGRWPHCKWSEQLDFSTGWPCGTSGPICSQLQTTPQLHNCAH